MKADTFVKQITKETQDGWVRWLAPSVINEYLDPESQETTATVSVQGNPVLVFLNRLVSPQGTVRYTLAGQKQYELTAKVHPPVYLLCQEEEGGALETLWNTVKSQNQ